MARQEIIEIETPGRGTFNITRQVQEVVSGMACDTGLCHVFVQHTSASLMLCENADPAVRSDVETFLGRLVPDGDPSYRHDDEGPDDMPAHIRSILTNMDLTLPVVNGRLGLGTWQGIYLYEHRTHAHRRRVIVTVTT
ncbi:MAG: secondary thiamine-phosphate synthase enzyme YjbQ [bacterium]